ncbi:MAG TPA: helix-turn-helix domain-containing protein [Thermomicrobiales bacterium]|nr:helix-turn-helix domain-containing protein [Thermomicrobiales bacterium]
MTAPDPTQKREPIASVCPRFHRAVELIGRRWTGAILSAMLSGASRFTDIVNAVPGLSDRLLSERLKELENEGIVRRVVHPDTPVRIEYLLTEKGRDLSSVVDAVGCWANRWLEPIPCDEAELDALDRAVPTLATAG